MSEPTNQQSNEIHIPANELLTLLGAVQLASSRGAFRPEEFKGIGTAYENLFSFLSSIGVIQGSNTAQ
jgi:hypothetical protein